MPRRNASLADPEPLATITPNSVWTIESAQSALGLGQNTLPAAIKRGELRVSCIGGKRLIRGKWLLRWLECAAAKRERRQAESVQSEAG